MEAKGDALIRFLITSGKFKQVWVRQRAFYGGN